MLTLAVAALSLVQQQCVAQSRTKPVVTPAVDDGKYVLNENK